MCKAENKCSDLGRVSPRMLAYLIRLVSPLSSSSLRNLLFDFFSRGGLPVCARCRRKVDVPGEYLTGLNWNEAKKRNEGTIILRERKGRARGEREREGTPTGWPGGGVYPAGTPTRSPPADVFIVLVQPRNSHSAGTRNFAHHYHLLPLDRRPPPPIRERKIFFVDSEVEGVERLSRISRERKNGGGRGNSLVIGWPEPLQICTYRHARSLETTVICRISLMLLLLFCIDMHV